MEIDINLESHDLLWRLMPSTFKKRYTDSFGVKRAEIVETEMAKLIASGLIVKNDNGYELTPKGRELYSLLTQKSCCQPA